MQSTAGTLRQRFYPITYNRTFDGTPLFLKWTRERLSPGCKVLDLGAGPGCELKDFTDAAQVTAVDIDKSVLSNPYAHERIIADAASLPLPSNTFDVCLSDFVFEHLEQPKKVINEVRRVLRPGGSFVIRTPNVLHYISLASIFMPDSLRADVLKRVGRKEEDSFPTLYRFNSRRTIVRVLKECRFEIEEMRCVEGPPDYLASFPALYRLGVLYERLVNSSERLSFLRANILVAARKTTY